MSVRRTPRHGTSGQLPGTLHGVAIDFKPGYKPPLHPANTSCSTCKETAAELEGVEAQTGDLYENIQVKFSFEEHKKVKDLMKIMDGNYRTKHAEDFTKRRLDKKATYIEGVAFWIKEDYSKTPVKTADELFEANHGKLDNRVGADIENTTKLYPSFDPAWSVWYAEPGDSNCVRSSMDNAKTQTTLLDQTYNDYVGNHTKSKAVQEWTKEEDDDGNLAPHQIMEDCLLKATGLYDRQKDRVVYPDERDEATKRLIKRLYNLVTEAPRCPVMMSFVRTVLFDTRLPNDWFAREHRREMAVGDSVVLPVFMSTSNSDIASNWFGHGPASLGMHTDTRQPTANCCVMQVIVSKGTPMLPLGDFKSNADHAHENEILLPPGIELVYLGLDEVHFNRTEWVHLHTFITRM